MIRAGQLTLSCRGKESMIADLDKLAKRNNLSRSKFILLLCEKAVNEQMSIRVG